MASRPKTRCPHVNAVTLSWDEINEIKKNSPACFNCKNNGINQWLCLKGHCKFVGCGEKVEDHISGHYSAKDHPLAVNLTNSKIYCSTCDIQVVPSRNIPSFLIPESDCPNFETRKSSKPPPAPNVRSTRPVRNNFIDNNYEDEDDGSKPLGLTGLKNLGNTCYMNSGIQALSNCPQITQYFLECGSLIYTEKKPMLSLHYKRLLMDMWHKKRPSYVVPSGVCMGIKMIHPMFRGFSQQDSQEFLRCFMDQLHEEMKSPVLYHRDSNLHNDSNEYLSMKGNSTNDNGDVPSHSHNDKKNKKGDSKKPEIEYRSIISDVFNGKLLSSVECLMCERVSSTKEVFQDLSLPIAVLDKGSVLTSCSAVGGGTSQGDSVDNAGSSGEATGRATVQGVLKWTWIIGWAYHWVKSWFVGPAITIQDCLAAFFSEDELKGDNMYSCEKCKKLRNGLKSSRLLELPEVLCVHLKRFRHNFSFSSKITTYVSFPVEGLDMSPYLHKDCQDSVTTYDLIGVVCHRGTAGGGHYTAYAYNNAWYEFDDEEVTEVDVHTVLNCEAYILFYRKKDDAMIPIRQRANDLITNSEDDSLLNFYVSKGWIVRFNNCAEPGPITNDDFLCPHGYLQPDKVSLREELAIEVSAQVWNYLYDLFGGGPAVTHMSPCAVCQELEEKLKARQEYEFNTVVQLHEMFRNCVDPPSISAISLNWFKEWEDFARGKESKPPGPIDNSTIATMNRSGQRILRSNCESAQMSRETWIFLHSIYGGGPEMCLKITTPPPSPSTRSPTPDLEEELQNQEVLTWINNSNGHAIEIDKLSDDPIENEDTEDGPIQNEETVSLCHSDGQETRLLANGDHGSFSDEN